MNDFKDYTMKFVLPIKVLKRAMMNSVVNISLVLVLIQANKWRKHYDIVYFISF